MKLKFIIFILLALYCFAEEDHDEHDEDEHGHEDEHEDEEHSGGT